MTGERLGGALVAAAMAMLASGNSARAQEPTELPEGIPIGPWIVAPSFLTGVGYDTNPFIRNDASVPPPNAERVARVNPAVSLARPFRNSVVKVDYSGTWLDYSETELTKNWIQDYGAEALFRFGTGDVVRASATRLDGIADTFAFDPGGEVVYQGDGYAYNIYTVAMERATPGRRGYGVQLVHEDLNFDKGTEPAYFDFRGMRADASYREPLGPRTWIDASYTGRRFDQFLANRPDLVGQSFRQEEEDSLWTGIVGILGLRGAFRARVGWTSQRFYGEGAGTFTGIQLDGFADVPVGGGSRLRLVAQRYALPSYFFDNTYYLSTSLGTGIERMSPTGKIVGGSLAINWSRYDVPIVPAPDEDAILRNDRWVRIELYATVPIRRFIGVRVTALLQKRTSTYEPVEYDQAVLFGGLWFGWFQ